MKKQFTLLVCILFALNSFGQISIPMLEEFDTAPNENIFGVFSFNNYGATVNTDANYTAYTFEQDVTGMLSGVNSAKLNIGATGNQWWTIQLRLENLIMAPGDSLELSFIAQASGEMSFVTVVEATDGTHDPFRTPVTLTAFDRKTITMRTASVSVTSNNNFIIGLGNSTAVACELWIDSVSIKSFNRSTGIKDVASKDNWVLKQMGNQLQIESNGTSNSLKVEFFDLLGRKFSSQNIHHTGTSKVTLPEYYNAIYIVRIMDEHNNHLADKKIQVIK
jgi:hypothetical protein